jgi:hypothetical protein
MRIFISKILVAGLAGAFLVTVSCTPGSCFEETGAFLKASFYLSSTGKLQAPDSLTLFGIDRETSKIYNKSARITQALLPLNSSAESCGFVIMINGINDTLSFSYTTYPHLLSKECGYTFYHTIDLPVFSKNLIDSVIVRKNTITTFNEENIRIYY